MAGARPGGGVGRRGGGRPVFTVPLGSSRSTETSSVTVTGQCSTMAGTMTNSPARVEQCAAFRCCEVLLATSGRHQDPPHRRRVIRFELLHTCASTRALLSALRNKAASTAATHSNAGWRGGEAPGCRVMAGCGGRNRISSVPATTRNSSSSTWLSCSRQVRFR